MNVNTPLTLPAGLTHNVSGGALSLNATTTISNLNLTGGTVSCNGSLIVNNSFTQSSSGSIAKTGSVSINQASGALSLGDISTGTLSVTATGAVTQNARTALAVTNLELLGGSADYTLTSSTNNIAAL